MLPMGTEAEIEAKGPSVPLKQGGFWTDCPWD